MKLNKKIILHIPYHFELPYRFKQNLEFLGFQVFLLPEPKKIKLSIWDTLRHGFRKFLMGDRSYKSYKKSILQEQSYKQFLTKTPECDYALVIRPDLISKNTILEIKKKANKIIAYQWDGIERFFLDKSIITEFDRFFVFDKNDVQKHTKFEFTTNFYFDDLILPKEKIENDIFFVGTYMKNRINQLLSIRDFFEKKNYIIDFHIGNAPDDWHENKIQTSRKGFSFTENIQRLKKSRILLDLKTDVHSGLSFRVFESIGYHKKLITNNELVKDYDFYHPNNIFILNEKNIKDLDEFLEKPYQEISKEIYKKYSFTYWIFNLLNI